MRFNHESSNKLASYYEQDNTNFSKITENFINSSRQEIIREVVANFDVTDSKHPWNWKKSIEEQWK